MKKFNTRVPFRCKCGLYHNWVKEGCITKPCPACGRTYKCKYDKKAKTYTISELKQNLFLKKLRKLITSFLYIVQ